MALNTINNYNPNFLYVIICEVILSSVFLLYRHALLITSLFPTLRLCLCLEQWSGRSTIILKKKEH